MHAVVRQNAAVVLVCRVAAVSMRGCVPACCRVRDPSEMPVIGPEGPVMRPCNAGWCLESCSCGGQWCDACDGMQGGNLGSCGGCFLRKRRVRILSCCCMHVLGSGDHSAAQHVWCVVNPRLVRVLVTCMPLTEAPMHAERRRSPLLRCRAMHAGCQAMRPSARQAALVSGIALEAPYTWPAPRQCMRMLCLGQVLAPCPTSLHAMQHAERLAPRGCMLRLAWMRAPARSLAMPMP